MSIPAPQNDITGFKPLRIAHAAGGIDGRTYTNSYEALDTNLEKGFEYFEIDFSFTSDGELVCLHDWDGTFQRTFGYKTEDKVTLKEFENLVESKSRYTNCTLNGLALWMLNNPSSYIVTDVKEDNLKALRIISEVLPSANKRVIPQIYQPENFNTVKNLGFEQVIWTLYRSAAKVDEVIDWVLKFEGSVAVTMPEQRAKTVLPKLLSKINVPTYVHTINSLEKEADYLTTYGISEIYTDFLIP